MGPYQDGLEENSMAVELGLVRALGTQEGGFQSYKLLEVEVTNYLESRRRRAAVGVNWEIHSLPKKAFISCLQKSDPHLRSTCK